MMIHVLKAGVTFLSLYLVFSCPVSAADPLFIEVITSDAYPVSGINALKKQGVHIKVYNLDDGKRLVSGLGKNLPHDEQKAKKALQQWFNKTGMDNVRNQFMTAYQAITVATKYGLTRYPAVVFNQGQSVIYGMTQLPRAVSRYQQWKTP